MEKLIEFKISSQVGERIDKVITSYCGEYSRSFIQKLVKDGKVMVNDKIIKSNYRVEEQDKISFIIPEPVELDILPEKIELDILYEDNDIIVINKGKGMVVHPAVGHYSGTIVNGLLYHCKNQLSGINGVMRPGIVHRIDKNTTGVIVACKNDKAHHFIAEQLKVHSITRKYRAIVWNTLNVSSGIIDAPIGRHPTDRKKMAINERNGKHAITHYHLLDNMAGKFAYIECQLETGRTHQIRVHLASIHHPLLGDDVYGSGKSTYKLEGQTLHAMVLGFIHPTTKKYIEFEAPLPSYFREILDRLQK